MTSTAARRAALGCIGSYLRPSGILGIRLHCDLLTQVVNGQAVGANALVDCALGTVIFSTSAGQTLYVEDVTSWNSASLDLWIQLERVN